MTLPSISAEEIRQIEDYLKGYLFYQTLLRLDRYEKQYFQPSEWERESPGELGLARARMFEVRHAIMAIPNCDEKLLRQALSLAIDRQLLVDAFWGDYAYVPAGHQFESYGDLFVDYEGIPYDLEKAKELLMCSSMKTSDIGHKVGYKDSHYFSYIFKKKQGCSPKEYRARKKEN